MRYLDEDDSKEPPTALAYFGSGRYIDGEIWPGQNGGFEVKLFCSFYGTRWWQWWRSDLLLPRGKQKGIRDALKIARHWIRRKGEFSPSYIELKIDFTKSD